MQKRGQFKAILSILIGVVVLIVLLFAFRSVNDVVEGQATAEIINLRTSIETRILQQSARSKGSETNVSFSVPSSVARLCFFDADKKYDALRNPEISGLYGDDKSNNFILLTDDGFFQYSFDKVEIDEQKNPLCAKIIDNKVNLKLISTGEKTRIEASEETEDIKCVSVLENGDPEKKIDFVFLDYGFEKVDEFNEEVNRYINNILLEFEPYKEFRDKFNFYRVDDAEVECTISGYIQCDQYMIKQAAADCPHDYIVLLVDRNIIKDFINPVRSSAIANIAKINTADSPFVLVHELGHTFADLADEYVDEGYYSNFNFDAGDYINCDSEPCASWQTIDETGCFKGCSLDRYFRPTKDSVMRSLNSPTYGPVNERELLKRLLYYE